jgi:hypothetical protein
MIPLEIKLQGLDVVVEMIAYVGNPEIITLKIGGESAMVNVEQIQAALHCFRVPLNKAG